MTPARVPFTVIGGLLGAGKTSLIAHVLGQVRGERLAVLVNDFGALLLDPALVAHAGGDRIELVNGCVCCAVGEDWTAALEALMGEGAERPDAVIVEASGVADPWRIAQYAIADPRLVLDGVIAVVNAETAPAQAADPLMADTFERVLARADAVLLNQADRAGAAGLAAAQACLARHVAATRDGGPVVVEAVRGRVPAAWVSAAFGPGPGPGPRPRAAAPRRALLLGAMPRIGPGAGNEPGHDRRFESASWRIDAPLDAAALRAWLEALPGGVLRAKAWLRSPDGGGLDGQRVGRRIEVRAAPRPETPGAAVLRVAGGALLQPPGAQAGAAAAASSAP